MHQAWTALVARIIASERDLVIAFVFAIIGAFFWDVVKTGSAAGIRQLRNKLSEQSVARLRERIVQMEKYRDVLNSYLSSDRALYLATLRLMLGILMFVCLGAVLTILNSLLPLPGLGFSIMALFIFIIAIVLCVYGAQLTGLDTRSKISEKIAALNSETDALKAKLDSQLQKTAG
jgi:ABC-type multidrug transport system fused ATPase/permease subunit